MIRALVCVSVLVAACVPAPKPNPASVRGLSVVVEPWRPEKSQWYFANCTFVGGGEAYYSVNIHVHQDWETTRVTHVLTQGVQHGWAQMRFRCPSNPPWPRADAGEVQAQLTELRQGPGVGCTPVVGHDLVGQPEILAAGSSEGWKDGAILRVSVRRSSQTHGMNVGNRNGRFVPVIPGQQLPPEVSVISPGTPIPIDEPAVSRTLPSSCWNPCHLSALRKLGKGGKARVTCSQTAVAMGSKVQFELELLEVGNDALMTEALGL